MADPWESLTSILVVAIPTLIGALTTKFIVNEWQDKQQKFNLQKDKYALRQQLLASYQKGYVRPSILLNNFEWKVLSHYTRPVLMDGNESHFDVKFPPDSNEYPTIVFGQEFKDVVANMDASLQDSWSFYTDAQLYFDDKDLIKDLGDLGVLRYKYTQSITLLLQSQNEKEFEERYARVNKSWDLLKEVQKKISKNLASLNLRRIPD